MGTAGRPPKPNEVKRRTGNPGKRPLPRQGEVVALPAAEGVPDYPADLGLAGRQVWDRAWQAGITWISPKTDLTAVEQTCRLADDIAAARERYRATRDPADGRIVVAFQRELAAALAALGFDPAGRTRLGVAEVTRMSKLEALRAQRSQG